MSKAPGQISEWIAPLAFILCAGWVIWHLPAFTLDFYPPDASQADNLRGLHHRNDVTPGMGGPFGGEADWIDWLAIIAVPIIAVIGVRAFVRRS